MIDIEYSVIVSVRFWRFRGREAFKDFPEYVTNLKICSSRRLFLKCSCLDEIYIVPRQILWVKQAIMSDLRNVI